MEIAEDLKAAKDVIQVFLKAKKILRMYPPNNPIYIKSLEDSFSRFKEFFHYKDELTYTIRQYEINYTDESVYANPGKDDNLALFFFKDGLREISFKNGITQEEMEEFLKIISLDFDKEVIDDDLVTLFWEKDFQNVQYVVDEAYLADEEDYESQAMEELEAKKVDPDNIMQAYVEASKEIDKVKEVSIVPLSDKDLKMLNKEMDEDSQDKTDKLIDILFEMLLTAHSKEDYADVVDFLAKSIEYSVRNGNIQSLAGVLSQVYKILADKNANEVMRKSAKRIQLTAGSEKIINLLGEVLDSGQEVDEKLFASFVRFLDKNSILPFMKILGELESIHARKIVIDALIFQGPKDLITLAKGLNDARWYVVRNIIYILRKIGDKRAVDYLLKTVKHGDIRVKKEVIRTLGELGGANVLVVLRDCLADLDVHVRSAALKALGSISSEAAKRIIMDRIADKHFKDKVFEEKKEYFEVLAMWKDNTVYEFFIKTIKKKAFWKRSKNFEKRACAAYGLGLLGNKDSLPVLNKFKGSSNKVLREFSYTAIKRIEHGKS
jgi:HEAT repeat protein